MINLCVDQGNSSTKVGIFNNTELIYTHVFTKFGIVELRKLKDDFNPENCILSNVVGLDHELYSYSAAVFSKFIALDQNTKLPFINSYKTPETLGRDRLAVIAGACFLKPNANLLVIDAGTAITYDFIDANGIYRGGNIAPGVDMRLKSLNVFTEKLPLVEPESETTLLGTDTKSAILNGVINGIVYEINGYIDELKTYHADLLVFLTGGSIFYFYTKLKSPIFVDKNLVLTGLNRILRFNV